MQTQTIFETGPKPIFRTRSLSFRSGQTDQAFRSSPRRWLCLASKRLVAGLLVLVGLSLSVNVALAIETVEEKYDNGQLKLKYEHLDGKKTGLYLEFYENGKPQVKARYKKDQLEGKYVSYHENGEPKIETSYKRGKLHGKYAEKDDTGNLLLEAEFSGDVLHGKRIVYDQGKPHSRQEWSKGELASLNGHRAHTRSKAQIEVSLRKIFKTRIRMQGANKDHAMALRRLNAYRFLCGLPANIRLDQKETIYAQAAADVLLKLGQGLTHFPSNPGLSEADFKTAATGAKMSNLAHFAMSNAHSVDMYMYDSDAQNIEIVGHRMWCLSQFMGTTGFGRAKDEYYAMFSMDQRGRNNKNWKIVRFPPAGYIPVDYFNGTTSGAYAWSVALNSKFFKYDEDFTIEVYPLDENLDRGEALVIREKHVAEPDKYFAKLYKDNPNNSSNNKKSKGRSGGGKGRPGSKPKGLGGYPTYLVFQPEGIEARAGNRYWAKLGGIKTAAGKPLTIEYLVEFIDPVEGATIGGPNGDPKEGSTPNSNSRR